MGKSEARFPSTRLIGLPKMLKIRHRSRNSFSAFPWPRLKKRILPWPKIPSSVSIRSALHAMLLVNPAPFRTFLDGPNWLDHAEMSKATRAEWKMDGACWAVQDQCRRSSKPLWIFLFISSSQWRPALLDHSSGSGSWPSHLHGSPIVLWVRIRQILPWTQQHNRSQRD